MHFLSIQRFFYRKVTRLKHNLFFFFVGGSCFRPVILSLWLTGDLLGFTLPWLPRSPLNIVISIEPWLFMPFFLFKDFIHSSKMFFSFISWTWVCIIKVEDCSRLVKLSSPTEKQKQKKKQKESMSLQSLPKLFHSLSFGQTALIQRDIIQHLSNPNLAGAWHVPEFQEKKEIRRWVKSFISPSWLGEKSTLWDVSEEYLQFKFKTILQAMFVPASCCVEMLLSLNQWLHSLKPQHHKDSGCVLRAKQFSLYLICKEGMERK